VAKSRRAGRSAEGLVVAGGIEGELAERGPVLGDDADVAAGDEEGDRAVPVFGAEGDVAEPAEVAQGDGAFEVGAVLADAEIGGRCGLCGMRLEAFAEGDQR